MRNVGKSVFLVCLLTVCLLMLSASLFAQTTFPVFNPAPCDFNDDFYTVNGFDVNKLNTTGAGRFGTFRQTGPPAFQPGQVNWVTDSNCSANDPNTRDIRVLATTGAYRHDTGLPTEFFSAIAFVLDQRFFTGKADARGHKLQDMLDAFEAYAAPKQSVNGVLAPSPCGTMGDGLTPCFPVTSIATPALRQDWRLTSNRTALDGTSRGEEGTGPPFSYFGDDLTGSWIVTYFWFTKYAVGGRPDQPTPTANCRKVLAAAGAQNGFNLDGTPIIHSGEELEFLAGSPDAEAQFGLKDADRPPATAPCAQEGNLDPGGKDGGAVWLVCPTILDPRNGAIAQDAFLDVVRSNGSPIDARFQTTFSCLQNAGKFCDE